MTEIADNIKTNRVLALSGGGVKGIAELKVLIEIEERTGKSISELFPIISGTSVGGLIAGLLTIPKEPGSKEAKYSATEALEIFKSSASDIFPSSFLGISKFFKNLFFHKYSQKPLKKLLEEHLGDNKMDSSTSRLIVPVTDATTNKLKICDSFDDHNPLIKHVLLATTAAPTFFKAVIDKVAMLGHNDASYVDGGLEANRPASEVLKLLKTGHTREEQKKILDNTMICSFNFDEPNDFILPTYGLSFALNVKDVIDNSIKSKETSSTAEVKIDLPGENEFFEIKLPITEEAKNLDDASPENIQRLEEIGRKYVQENSELIQKLCDNLLDNLNKELAANEAQNVQDEGFEEDYTENTENNVATASKSVAQLLESKDEGFEDDVEYEKEELLIGVKKFLNELSEQNPELKKDIEHLLDKAENYTLEEIKGCIVSFEQASLKWQEEQKNFDMFNSCSMEALKEDMSLEGEEHTDDAPGYNEIVG